MLGLYVVITKSAQLTKAWLTKGIHSESTEGIQPPSAHLLPTYKAGAMLQSPREGRKWNATMTLEFRADPATENHVTLSAMDWVFVSPPNSYVEALIANMTVFVKSLGGNSF